VGKDNIISDVIAESPNRRSLLKKLGIATAAAAGAAFTTGGIKLRADDGVIANDPTSPTVVDVLQFALNLEYLEAEFYTFATTGQGIDQPPYNVGISGPGQGPTTGGSQVNFSNNFVFTAAIAAEIGNDERAHVTLLRSALSAAGVTPVGKPSINLAALASMGLGFGSEAQFLALARIFEDIGVTAYGGAAALPVVSSSPYIGTAARILATEAEHVGNIRLEIARLGIQSPKLDGVDIVPPPSGTSFISADSTTGLTAVRTPGQVLFLAYGMQANVTSGGFFPNGVNGNLVTSSASA
jgi:hypothetical protein